MHQPRQGLAGAASYQYISPGYGSSHSRDQRSVQNCKILPLGRQVGPSWTGFWHIISLDGLEIAATALSSTMECPTCDCPKAELDRTDKLYPVRSTADVQAGVEKARRELLNRDGSIKDRCIGKVMISYMIS